ncbi:hypothetical protein BCh11DRAFT_04425 [Burkholderia sp. Ch1-1]|nr:hypothetical protein BCh11DRAFT_04425 [Burkholderia sp. Ch1-1]
MIKKSITHLKAIVIDDAYGRPSVSDLRSSTETLRQFLADVPAAKTWFDQTFGLSGSSRSRTYFEPMLQDEKKVLKLWTLKHQCPESERLVRDGMPDLVAEVAPLREPLIHIEGILSEREYTIQTFAQLPSVDETPPDLDLIVVDYVLSADTPRDMVAKLEESTNFLRALVSRAADKEGASLPLIVLVSSRPAIEKRHAENFRRAVGLQGAYFQFIRKKLIKDQLALCIDGFKSEFDELERYRKAHDELRKSLTTACDSLIENVAALELQDIAALHVGHLLHEGEPLSDYLGWMLGQVLTANLQRSVGLAEASFSLPTENHRVLLGHLRPTQGIPKLFSELSAVSTASGLLQKNKKARRELRFGDIFAAVDKDGLINRSKFLLVISQTCDLLQCKITNGQVLCVEGYATVIQNSEADLIRATLRQLDDKGSTLVRLGTEYYQVEWAEANLLTLQQSKLQRERGFRFIGRMNEIYALEAQHNALHRLGRIGVPVKPGYGVVFGRLRLKVWSASSEIATLSKDFDSKTVVAVLRPRPKGVVAILLSGQVKKWLVDQFTKLQSESSLPKELVFVAEQLIPMLTSTDFHFLCKQGKRHLKAVSTSTLRVSKVMSITSSSGDHFDDGDRQCWKPQGAAELRA